MVTLKDGHEFRFFSGQYDTISVSNTMVLRGKGCQFLNKARSEQRGFEGDIQFDLIERMEMRESSIGDILMPAAVVFTGFVILVIYGHGFHGL